MFSGLSGLGCRRGADRSLTFAARIQFDAGKVTPQLERIQKFNAAKNPSRERKRAVSIALATLPLSVRFARANIAGPLRRWRCGLGAGGNPR